MGITPLWQLSACNRDCVWEAQSNPDYSLFWAPNGGARAKETVALIDRVKGGLVTSGAHGYCWAEIGGQPSDSLIW